MSAFYSIDSTKVSHREKWWWTRSPTVLIAWLMKWLRVQLPCSTDDPNVDFTLPFLVEALPDDVRLRFQTLVEELNRLGFLEPVYHVIHDPGTSTTIYWATFRHDSKQCFARIHQRIWQQAKVADRGTFVMFFTAFTDGGFMVSSSGKPDLDAPPAVQVQRLRGASTATLWEAHTRLAAAQCGKGVESILTREDLLRMSERYHVALRDFHLTRGVFRQRSGAEEAQAQAFTTTVAEARAAGLAHPEVLAELERLQTERPGWGNAMILLLVSAAAFLAAGAARQNWNITLWLIPVLLFHEAGHWMAMKVFGYRNLRMFFIPLFGAAVTGRHWNVPGWKKGLVALAGPVPGIALGVGLTLAGLITGLAWLKTAALLLLLLNGFNLLPILPLDGGHLLHATLFSRNRWLDISFRLLAVAGLLLLAFAGLGKFLMYLGIAMAVGLPMAFKMSKATDALRRVELSPPLPGEDRIPVATAEAIITVVKAQLPGRTTHKMLAQSTLNVFETLNARPPGVLGTLGLLSLQGGSILLVLLCGFLLLLDKHGGGLGGFARAVSHQPSHALECGSHALWSGEAAPTVVPRNTTVTTFQRHAQAQHAFDALTNQLSPAATLCLAGDSLLLSLPADDETGRERWYHEFYKLSTNTFVVRTNRAVTVSLMFVAPTELAATNLLQELGDYFQLAGFSSLAEFVPPWSPDARKPKYQSTRQGRRGWRRIEQDLNKDWRTPETKLVSQKIAAALRRGAQDEADTLSKEQAQARETFQARSYAQLKAQGSDGELLDLHARFAKLHYTNRLERAALVRQIAARLGGIEPENATPIARYDATGYVRGHGLLLELTSLSFKDSIAGFPALMDWLCQNHCRNLKYEIHPGYVSVNDEDQ